MSLPEVMQYTVRGKRVYHHWTEDEIAIVRRDFRQTHASAREIAARLGVSAYGVMHQAELMGLCKATDYRRKAWTENEDARLAELVGRFAVGTIANKMHRSPNSVTVRIKRLGLSRRGRDGWYTKLEACQILGHDHKWVQRRIDSGALRATWHTGRQPQQNGTAMWHILEADLKAFIRRYPQELIGRNIDIIAIVDILAGMETPRQASDTVSPNTRF